MQLLWTILFLLFVFIEIVTVSLVTIWFALGAFVALFVSLFTNSAIIQWSVFVVVSIITLLITKPIADKFKRLDIIPTNSDRVLGKEGIVTKEITKDENGEVKVLGTVWTAKGKTKGKIEVGTEVVVESIDGVKLIVSKKEK